MSEDHWEEGGNIFVDFSGDARSRKQMKDQIQRTRYNNMDLASGYPEEQIWTTKDGQRIAIPNLADSHLLNILAYIRRRIPIYKQQIIAKIAQGIVGNLSLSQSMLFENAEYSEEVLNAYLEKMAEEGRNIFVMSDDEFLREFVPKYRLLYQEAYSRKIYFEVDSTKIGA